MHVVMREEREVYSVSCIGVLPFIEGSLGDGMGTPTPRCHGNRSLLVVLFLLVLRVVPHGTKGTGPKFVSRPVCASL